MLKKAGKCILVAGFLLFFIHSIPLQGDEPGVSTTGLEGNRADATPTVPANIVVADSAESSTHSPSSRFSIKVSVSRVNLFVSVVDPKGRPVKNLRKSDFLLWEDGVPHTINQFATYREAGLSIAVLLDASGSMGLMEKFSQSVQAITTLAEAMESNDEIALFSFSDGIVTIKQPFTKDKYRFLHMLRKVKPFGKTALYWAVDVMPRIMGNPKNRQAIVLFTDGIDNLSQISFQKMLEHAEHSKVPIYTFGFETGALGVTRSGEEYARITVMRNIAFRTGGVYYPINDSTKVSESCKAMFNELRYQYILGYKSNLKHKPGSYHKITLKCKKKKYIVRVRKGYYTSSLKTTH